VHNSVQLWKNRCDEGVRAGAAGTRMPDLPLMQVAAAQAQVLFYPTFFFGGGGYFILDFLASSDNEKISCVFPQQVSDIGWEDRAWGKR